jgi:hypothetical protein
MRQRHARRRGSCAVLLVHDVDHRDETDQASPNTARSEVVALCIPP